MNIYKKRFAVINEMTLLTQTIYPGDLEMMIGVERLTNYLNRIDPDEDFINGMLGFINWMYKNDKPMSQLLTNLIHDAGEYRTNGNEDWFSPRTASYKEFANDEDYIIIRK